MLKEPFGQNTKPIGEASGDLQLLAFSWSQSDDYPWEIQCLDYLKTAYEDISLWSEYWNDQVNA